MQNNEITAIHASLLVLVKRERRILNEILEHLSEINRRKAFLKFGHSSLLKYCVKELGYSESAAYRRIKALKITQELPAVKKQIEEGTVNLSQLCKAQNLFDNHQKETKKRLATEEKRDLLKKIEKKNCFDSENKIRKELNMPLKKRRIQIEASEKTYEKWIKFKGRMAHKQMTDEMLLCFAIRKAWELVEPGREYKTRPNNKKSRYIPVQVRRALLKQANFQCSMQGCESSYALEIDHIKPVREGGLTEKSNLRVLCRHHNLARNFEEREIKKGLH
ncbi:MAG: HNH endonuclease signature motif containing protein [Bacteriovoracaceae bacterium]